MKVSKQQLRRIIKEIQEARVDLDGRPNDFEDEEAEEEYDEPAVNDAGQALFVMVDDLVTSIKSGRVSAEAINDGDDGELYIMTGQAEGITVKVVRRGR